MELPVIEADLENSKEKGFITVITLKSRKRTGNTLKDVMGFQINYKIV